MAMTETFESSNLLTLELIFIQNLNKYYYYFMIETS